MSPYFPGIASEEFSAELLEVAGDVVSLEKLYDEVGVADGKEIESSAELTEVVERIIFSTNTVSERIHLCRAYISSFVTTDSTDEVAMAKDSELQSSLISLNKLSTRLVAWIGRLPLEDLVADSDVVAAHEYYLGRAKFLSGKMMSAAEEALAADLSESGVSAWSRLYGTYSSQISVEFQGESLPISAVQNLASDPDSAVRGAAYEAEIAA